MFNFFLWAGSTYCQDTITNQKPFSSNILSIKNPSTSISFSGYYRFLGFVRNQQETFPNNSGKTLVISSGDAYREPMFLLKLNGKTRDNITFGADLMINSLYKGPSSAPQPLTLDLGLNMSTSITTKHGIFKFKSGGVSWYRQSRLTVWGNRSLNRMSIFERRPQTPLNKIPISRYTNYYNSGLIDEGIRYGSRAFQGIFLQGSKLPFNFSLKGVIGKSNFNRSSLETSDNFTGCFQLKNSLSSSSKITYNYLSSWADIDSLSDDRRNYFIHTLEFDKKWNKEKISINFFIEILNLLAQKIPIPPEYGLQRDDIGNIITPYSLVEVDVNRESIIPSFGFSVVLLGAFIWLFCGAAGCLHLAFRWCCWLPSFDVLVALQECIRSNPNKEITNIRLLIWTVDSYYGRN